MKTIKSVLLWSALLAAMAGGTAWAAPGHGGGHGWHGGGWHGGGGHFRGRVGVVIGGPLYWPSYSYPSYPYYPYYPGPYYSPPVVVTPAPQTYIEQGSDAADQYWYFCSNPQGYYPYVQTCPSGWRQVTPQPPADGN